MQGFLNLNKPSGLTSHDCVARVRRLVRLKRVGHGGTLDPAATGVLPIALGPATRLLQYLPQDKAYRATIRLGVRTTTDDLEGDVIATESTAGLTLDSILPLLRQFEGTIQQVPPSYSAIQVKGKRLYDLARAGEAVEVPERTVEIYKIDVLDWRPGELAEIDVAIACGSGTYIRAIARDLGVLLNTGGTLASLLRTRSCGFNLPESLTLEDVETQLQQETFQPIPPAIALRHLSAVTLPPEETRRWYLGQRLPWLDSPTDASTTTLRVLDEQSNFLGIGEFIHTENGLILAPRIVFASAQSH